MADPNTVVVVLPIWVEYVKALGAPCVALVAAFIAGYIAYRQWRTAREKLKLDLFQRRLEVHSAAVTLLLKDPEKLTSEDVKTYLRDAGSALWLFDQEVVDFLMVLQSEALRDLSVQDMKRDEETDRIKEAMDFLLRIENRTTRRMQTLTFLMKPYLKIQH